MNKLFIDANIFLGFYNSNQPEFKKLLITLNELASRILVTHQIADEVTRNKLVVFSNSLANYFKVGNINSVRLPEHLDVEAELGIKTWNESRALLEAEGLKLNQNLQIILKDLLDRIAHSTDRVSIELQNIFSHAHKQGGNTLTKARMRKELGNPPGKPEDPLGDQLNWVQVLEAASKISNLFIVTKDHDFFTEYNNKLYLNPLLFKELLDINPTIKVSVYDKLSIALREFSKTEEIISLPKEDELKIILEEETPSSNVQRFKAPRFYGGGHTMSIRCPNCNRENWNVDKGEYLPSKFGGITYQYKCVYCNYLYDTLDYGDSLLGNLFT